MSQSFKQSKEWNTLISLLTQGKADSNFKPILWVGAGLSVAAGYPTTNKLIKQLRKNSLKPLPDFDPLDPTLKPNDPRCSFTHWIQQFADTNTYGRLNKALAGIFNVLPNTPTKTHLDLVKLPFKALYTTNYDALLEAALNQNNQPFNLVTHQQNLGLEQDELISLYKIHGGLNNIRDWTLDEDSYLGFADHYPFLDAQLKHTLYPHSIVYIGCSMLDPRVIDWYRYCDDQKQLAQLEYSITIMQKDSWHNLPDDLKTLYQKAKVQPLLIDTHDELPLLVAALSSALDEPEENNTAVVVPDPAERLARESQLIEDILYEELAPSIVQAIANVWLEEENTGDYLKHLKDMQGAKARNKGKQAFESLLENFVELYQRIINDTTGFVVKKTVFEAINTVLKAAKLNYAALNKVDFGPHALYGHLVATYTPPALISANKNTEQLYKSLLKKTCELIVDCCDVLPTWNEKNLIAQLEQSGELFKKLREVLVHWQTTNEHAMDEVTQLEEEYRRAVARRFDQLQIFGINFGKRARKYQLSVAYISLTTQTDFNSSTSGEILSTEEALTRFEQLIILGEAGQGKTTLLQWLTVQCGRKAFTGDKVEWNNKVPVLIKLREVLNNPKLPSANDFYSLMVDIKAEKSHRAWFNNLLTDKKAILMIDGFDEVPSARRNEVLRWIDVLCRCHCGNQIILTSRPAAYDEKALTEHNFQVIQLQTMDRTAQRDFITHWHQAIALEYDKTKPNAQHKQSEALLHRLGQQRTLSNLAENPLLCGVICLLHHDRSGYLPKNRTSLYEASCRMLSDSRDRERKVVEDLEFSYLDDTSKQAFITDVAQWMSKNEQTSLSHDELITRFTLKLNNLPDLKKQLAPKQLMTFFLERSGLLLKVNATEIHFAHRSFQEFFTAKYIVNERDWETLRQNATNNYWYETIQMAVGLCQSNKENEKFLLSLLDQTKKLKFWRDERNDILIFLLVLRCKEAMSEISPVFDKQIMTIIPKVVPPTSASMIDALATAGDLALPYLERPKMQTEADDFNCIQVLLRINTIESYRLLKDYFKPKHSDYIDRLCQVIETLDSDIVKAANLAQLILDDGLNRFPSKIVRKMAFLIQDPRLISPNLVAKLTEGNFDKWELLQGIAPLAACAQLKTLNLENTQIKDLKILPILTQLQTLSLRNTQIKDLTPLLGLTQLQELYLSNTQIDDIAQIRVFTRLNSLGLSSTKINDLTHLAQLTQLKSLDLDDTQISDLTPLATLTQLQSLFLVCPKITNISPLAKLTQLKNLDLSNTQVNDLTPLSALTKLEYLDLSNTQIRDLKPLTVLTQLKYINLRDVEITDLEPLTTLTQLQRLNLRGTVILQESANQKLPTSCKVIV